MGVVVEMGQHMALAEEAVGQLLVVVAAAVATAGQVTF
jgi:hypothetical protein